MHMFHTGSFFRIITLPTSISTVNILIIKRTHRLPMYYIFNDLSTGNVVNVQRTAINFRSVSEEMSKDHPNKP